MKRRINKQVALAALLSAVLLMGTVTGCTKKEKVKPAATTTTTETQTKTEEPKEAPKEEEKAEVKGTPITLKYFTMTCPDGWTIDEEEKDDRDNGSKAVIDIPDGDSYSVSLEVSTYSGDANYYRRELKKYKIDAYEMVENNAYTLKNIGGIDMVEYSEDGKLFYMGRDEAADMNIFINAYGETDDPRLLEAISTISFTLPDNGNIDPPWPWNGERYTTDKEHTAMVADKTIKAEYIPFDEPMVVDDIFSGRVELIGNSLWVLLDDRLYEYSIGDTLTFVKEVELSDTYDEISSDANGNLYITGFMRPMLTIKDGVIVASDEGVDKAIIDKSGTLGVSFFTSKVPTKVTIADNIASVSEWGFSDEKKASLAGLTKNYVYAADRDPETEKNALWIYDKDGNLKLTLGNVKYPELGSIGSLTDVIETDSGFMALDGNSRKLLLWKVDGTLIGEIEDADIFGTNYPWISTATLGDDGSIYVGLTEERDDESADEFVVYRLSGF